MIGTRYLVLIFAVLANVKSEVKQKTLYIDTTGGIYYQIIPIESFVRSKRIHFKVQALEDAYFALLRDVDVYNPLFELAIGVEGNTRSCILKNKKIVASANTPKVLDPETYKGFWISWHINSKYLDLKTVYVIRIGHETDDTPFLVYWDSDPSSSEKAYYIGVRSNPNSGNGFWLIDVTHNETNINTSKKEVVTKSNSLLRAKYELYYPIFNDRIEFKVKIDQNAWIVLSKIQKHLRHVARDFYDEYEVILGGWENTHCVILRNLGRTIKVNKECKGALHSEYYRGFWISLEYDGKMTSISVGNDGEVVPFMKHSFVNTELYSYYSVGCTGKDRTGYWILKVAPPHLIKYIKTLRTQPVRYLNFDLIPSSGLINIKTKAKRDAWVALSNYLNEPEFEIIIGGWNNGKSTIRRRGRDLAQFWHHHHLNCPLGNGSQYTGFWINVRQDNIKAKGVVKDKYLMIYVGLEDQDKAFLTYLYTLEKNELMQINHYSVESTQDSIFVDWILEASVHILFNALPKYLITYRIIDLYEIYALESQKVEFEIKVTGSAAIYLTTSARSPTIQIVLFDGGTVIRKNGFDMKTFKTFYSLSSDFYSGFWIEWKYNLHQLKDSPNRIRLMCLQLGYLSSPISLFEWCDREPFLIKYIGVETQHGIGYWKFNDDWLDSDSEKIMPQLIRTYDDPENYQFFPIVKSPIRFKVKTSRDAYLAFTSQVRKGGPLLKVLLGAFGEGWQSQYTYIRKKYQFQTSDEVSIKTQNLLTDEKFVGFWIDWEYISGNITSGQDPKMNLYVGLENEDDPFLTWKGKDWFPLNFVGVTSYKSSAVWIFREDIEKIEKKEWKEAKTYDYEKKYKFFPLLSKPLTIQVKASRNANIALASAGTESKLPLVEILIGTSNNTQTVIQMHRGSNDTKYSIAETRDILSDSYYESFWIDWLNITRDGKNFTLVEIGRLRDYRAVTFLVIEPFDFHFFGINSMGNTAFWHFREVAESLPPFITTNSNENNQYQFYLAPNHALKFFVKAANDVIIALSTTNSSLDESYEVIIGGKYNGKSFCMKNRNILTPDKEQITFAYTENYLSSIDLRGFWIDWVYEKQALRIRVGRAGEVHPFLRLHDDNPLPIKFIGFSSLCDNTLWKFEVSIEARAYDFAPDNFTQVTTSNFTYQFFSLPGRNMSFKVKTQSDADIVLSSRPEIDSLFPMYEIMIGVENKYSWIRRGNGYPEIIVNTPLVLSISEFRGYWVSWYDGHIDVGFMDKSEPFISWTDPKPYTINFIGITSRYSAVWQIMDTTIVTSDDEYHAFPIACDKVMFLIKAPENATLKLTSKNEEIEDPIVEVILGNKSNSEITFRREGYYYATKVRGVLDKNNSRGFWFSWALGKFTVGLRGHSNPLAFFNDLNAPSPNYIGFSGQKGITTTWQFKVAPAWKPVQWNSNNANPCFPNENTDECKDKKRLLRALNSGREDDDKRLVNDCNNIRWRNAFQCKKQRVP